MFIAIADSSIFCNQFFAFMTCRLYLPQMLIVTVKWQSATPDLLVLALKEIFVASNFWEIFWMMITLQLNMSLCLDLVLMIKYPFVNKESRMKYYISGSFAVAFFFGIMNVFYLNHGYSKKWPYILYIIWFTFFLLLAAYSTIYAAFKLMRPGISA
jgi:hypothetical protein